MATKDGGTQLGPYHLLRKLGEGGMGAVYLAEDPADGRRVAIKVLPRSASENPEFLRRFQREAEAAAKLRHPCIAAGYAAGEDRGLHFYAMEYCDGEPLDRMLKRQTTLPPQRALEILLQVTKGLQYAHAQGVIHRDIKPANIFITRDGSTKILDLGLAKTMGDSDRSFLTMSGAVVGTPHYLSPEQAEGGKVDGRADIYSLGATFYHLLTGQTPFDGSSPVEVMYKQVHGALPNPQDLREDIPDSYVHLLRRMMAKKPDDRYSTCDELFADLKEIITGGSPRSMPIDSEKSTIAPARKIRAVPKRPPTVRRPAETRSRAPVFIGVGAAAIAIVVGIVLLSGGPAEVPSKPVPAPAPKTAAPKPPASSPAAVSAPTSEPPADSWSSAVSLLPLIDVQRDVVKGTWTVENGELLSDNRTGARVVIPFEPPEEYDLRMEFTPVGPTQGVEMLLTRNGREFKWLMGAFANTHFGLGYRDGAEGKTGVLFKTLRPGGCLAAGWRYRTMVQVRRDRVTASLDGEVLVDGKPDLSTLSQGPSFPFPAGASLGVMSSQGTLRIHQLDLLEITGKGRGRRMAMVPPPARPVPVAPGPWRPLFDGRTADFLVGESQRAWIVRDGALQNVPGADTNAGKTREEFENVDLKIRFEVSQLDGLYFKVRQGPSGGYSMALNKTTLATLEGSPHEALFLCRGDSVTVTLDGRPIALSDASRSARGALQWNANGKSLRLLAIDVRDADEAARPWTPLFDGKTIACLGGAGRNDWRVENGAIAPVPGRSTAARTGHTVSDGQVRVRFEVREVTYFELHVRQGSEGAYTLTLQRTDLTALEGRPHEVVFTCDGDRVSATLDGNPADVTTQGRPRSGAIQVYRRGDGLRILSIDVRDLR